MVYQKVHAKKPQEQEHDVATPAVAMHNIDIEMTHTCVHTCVHDTRTLDAEYDLSNPMSNERDK